MHAADRPQAKGSPPERKTGAVNLIESRMGFFFNTDQFVSVRVLPWEEEGLRAPAAVERRCTKS